MIKPFSYQVPIIKNVTRALKRDGKTLMVMATGTGKTITGALVVEKLLRSKDRMLFLCHNNDILRQSMEAYHKVFNGSREFGMFTGEEKSDPKSVQFLFASFQTMHGWHKKFAPDAFDMVVVDESHHAQAETYRPTIEYFRPKYLLGKTATPDREDGKNIRDLFGDPSVELSLEEAIARKFLSDVDYKLMTVGTASRDAIRELKRRVEAGERITLRELNDNIFIERLDSDIADDIMSYKAQGIIFCTDIKQAEGMAKLLKKARPYHSKLDRRELDADLQGFRSGRIKYLLTVDMFNEGIDVPDTKLVVFLRSTESKTVYLQQLGRGLRKSPGKSHVTVLDFVGNCDRIKMVTDFMDRIDDFGPGDGRERGDRIRQEIDASSIIFELDQEARDIRDILSRLDIKPYPTMAEATAAVLKLDGLDTKEVYKRRYKEDPRLPSDPPKYYSTEWISWPHFLIGTVKTDLYPTLQEASKAVYVLEGIDSSALYKLRYKEDPRLPSNPNDFYASEWISWPHFLTGRLAVKIYPTIQEAKGAIQRLGGIDSFEAYKLRHKKDPRLPSNPKRSYAENWLGWVDYLGVEPGLEPYPTMAEATAAVLKLDGLDTKEVYKRRYKEDPRLPSSPNKHYASEWISWPHFLTGAVKADFYPTLQEAMAAIGLLGAINSREKYKLHYKKDSRLPSNPNDFYASEWKGWPHFLGKVKK